jgi:hypothetical protein
LAGGEIERLQKEANSSGLCVYEIRLPVSEPES